MKRAVKWILIVCGGLVALIILALLIAPMFIDIEKYKPMIEEKVAEATGRPFRLEGTLDLSLFPWAGVSLSKLHLGNPPGFEVEDFVYIESFEVRAKLLPLLSKDLQVKRFLLNGIQIHLEKAEDGRANWEGLGGKAKERPSEAPAEQEKPGPGGGLPLKALAVGDFSVTGSLLWIDRAAGQRKEITDVSLTLQDVSLERPISMAFSARIDGQPVSLEGELGPVGQDPMKGSLPLELRVQALDQLDLSMKGALSDLGTSKAFDLSLEASPFSPRELVSALGQPFPIATADPKALSRVALKVKAKGDAGSVALTDGLFELDESKLAFSVRAQEFSRPDLAFDLHLDRINLDRYLPPAAKKGPEAETAEEKPPAQEKAKSPDYGPLRRLILDGTLRIDEMTAKGLHIQDLLVKIAAKDGLIQMDPMDVKLYQGSVSSNVKVDVQGNEPKSRLAVQMNGIQAGPLVRDLADKDIIEGVVQGDISVNTVGDQPDPIKRSLNGKGELLFKDGAIVGIDLANMVRNVQSAFGMAEKVQGERPKTDFTELRSPFTIRNGLVNTPGTEMKSPLLRVVASGTANLVDESLNMRVEPKVVATIKGQGDTEERGGIRVPVLVTGTFSDPKFRPDLKGMFEEGLKQGIPDASSLKKMIEPGEQESGQSTEEAVKDKVKGLLKGFGLGD